MNKAEYWIQHLQLKPHPEGGFFKEVYRSSIEVSNKHLPVGYKSSRRLLTNIYYLLRSEDISRLHRLKSDEIWFFHAGSPLKLIYIDTEGKKHTHFLGNNHEKAEQFSLLVPGGSVFCAEVHEQNSYTLVSCVVSPGFEFEDFEVFDKEDLIQAYPKHIDLIEKYC
ncbi:MAG: cupin domain-containing protein [Bacteroidota bacterium]|nr:MAG: cupin domain-containing protein [Bacteroidota bacterium]